MLDEVDTNKLSVYVLPPILHTFPSRRTCILINLLPHYYLQQNWELSFLEPTQLSCVYLPECCCGLLNLSFEQL